MSNRSSAQEVKKMLSKKIISLQITLQSYSQTLNNILFLAKSRTPSYVCFANVHMTIEAFRSKLFASQVNKAEMVTADGVPLKIALKHLYGVRQERVAGMDMMPDLLATCEKQSLSVAFYGSSEDTMEAIEQRIQSELPRLKIATKIIPPYRELTIQEKNEAINQLNNSEANLVFVCLGCPKQEIWMAENSSQIHAVLLGVGGAFATYSGKKKRAPEWMRKFALEWLYRLFQEPGRMFKRYVVTNTLFLLLMAKEWFLIKILKRES